MARVLAAMSGGVDSSVATALLVREGHDVVGVSLQLSDESAGGAVSRCCSSADIRDARLVAGLLGIPYYVVNEEAEFDAEVRGPFLDAYREGRTPNPCVRCNSTLKFGRLLQIARAMGATRIATGHYARLPRDPVTGRPRLQRARDLAKDQSYFLFDLDDRQREAALFPLGDRTKDEVYALAAAFGLPVAGKAESQDLCFIPEGDTQAWLHSRIRGAPSGEIVDTGGRPLGRHGGIHAFTIGQRRGLGVSGARPLYVIRVDASENRVVVGEEADLASPGLVAASCRLHDPDLWKGAFRAEARIRSRHAGAGATVNPLPGGLLRVAFDEPQRAVTPGQALVVYRGDLVLGGGWIARAGLDPLPNGPVGCEMVESGRA